MSDSLEGLNPTAGVLHVGVSRRFKVEVLNERNEVVVDAYSAVDANFIVDAFNTYTATGLAPSQLAQSLADARAISAAAIPERDEARALNSELVGQHDEAVEALTELGTSCMVAQVHRDPRIHDQFVRAQDVAAKAKGKR